MALRKYATYVIGRDGFSPKLKGFAKQWLAEHPEEPAKAEPPKVSETYRKAATREGDSYSITLSEGRLTIYHWHGKDSESMELSGTVADFNQFDEERPEEWFDVAAKMIEIRSKK